MPHLSLSPLICDKRVTLPYLLLGSTRNMNVQEVLNSYLVEDTMECKVLKERALNPTKCIAEPSEMLFIPTVFAISHKHIDMLCLWHSSWECAP